jgi:hypothetical protein
MALAVLVGNGPTGIALAVLVGNGPTGIALAVLVGNGPTGIAAKAEEANMAVARTRAEALTE